MTFAPFGNGYRVPANSILGNNTGATAPQKALTAAEARALIGAVATDDPALTNARTPTGGAGGVLSGSYPNPGFAIDMATQAELNAWANSLSAVALSGSYNDLSNRPTIVPQRPPAILSPWLHEPYYAQSLTTFVVGANTLYMIPWLVYESMTVDALVCEVTAGVAGTGRMGIYRADASNPLLATRVAECGSTFDAGTPAVYTLGITPGALSLGWHYLVIVSTSAATFRAWSNVAAGAAVKHHMEAAGITSAPIWARFASNHPAGALPASITATGGLALTLSNGNAPRVLYRRTA